MTAIIVAIGVLLGIGVGFFLGSFFMRLKSQSKIQLLEQQQSHSEEVFQEKIKVFEEAQQKFENTFKALSSEALEKNNQNFLTLAKTQFERFQEVAKADLNQKQDHIVNIVKPVQESLAKVDQKLLEIERSRSQSEASLQQQMKSLSQTHLDLRKETSSLVAALRAPQTRGQWGEMQLKRVVEMAGMLEYCDFQTQVSGTTEEQQRLRPDLIVKLPAGKNIVVDAKTPLNSYLDAMEREDIKEKNQLLLEHSRHIRRHIEQLSRKSYWAQFQPSPEFVILFLPGESFFSAALEQDPSLIEFGVSQNVIIATPTTLISLLRAVSYGWRQELLNKNVQQMGELGRELYKRIADMRDYLEKLGKNLNLSVDAYNRLVGNIESRVLVSGRKIAELSSTDKNDALISELSAIKNESRQLTAPEFLEN